MELTIASMLIIKSEIKLSRTKSDSGLQQILENGVPLNNMLFSKKTSRTINYLRPKVLNFDLTYGEIKIEITNTSPESIDLQFWN